MSGRRPRIVVVGSTNTDMVVAARSLPRPGETLTGGTYYVAAGGKGANQAAAAARAAGPRTRVTFVAAVGDDDLGRSALRRLRAEGIDTRHVKTVKGVPSGVALILVDRKGENLIAVAPGANATLSRADIEKARKDLAGADVLLTQLETPLASVTRAIDLAARAGVRTILDPAPAPERPLPKTLLTKTSILTPNETEFAALAGAGIGSAGGRKAALRLASVLREALIVTEGKRGVRVFTRAGESRRIRAFRARAVDTVAAGDAFSGALAVALAEGAELHDAVRFAAAGAALSVEKAGAQPSLARRREILARLRRG